MNNSSRSNPLNSPDAAALLKDKSALKKLLASPEAKKLMSMLTAQDTGQLKSAAEQAKNGRHLRPAVHGQRPNGAPGRRAADAADRAEISRQKILTVQVPEAENRRSLWMILKKN